MSGTQEEAEKTCKEGDSCNEEDAGRKVAGSNPGAGKVFSREISVKYYLLFIIIVYMKINACVRCIV